MSIFFDSHVHIYEQFSIEILLNSALKNFRNAAMEVGESQESDFVLFFTEGNEQNFFRKLYKESKNNKTDEQNSTSTLKSWKLINKGIPHYLLATKANDHNLHLIAGSQLVSAENLELLSLFVPLPIPNKKLNLRDLIKEVSKAYGVVVLPWGVGKWVGSRSKVIKECLDQDPKENFFIGDNGNRPQLWPQPTLFSYALSKNLAIVSGSDPLPFHSHQTRVGSYGSWKKNVSLDQTNPIDSIRSLFSDLDGFNSFGKRTSTAKFVCDQFRINILHRLRR